MRALHLGAWGRNWGDRVIQWAMLQQFTRFDVELHQMDIQKTTFFGRKHANEINGHYDFVIVGGGGLFWEKPELKSPSGWQWQYDAEFMEALRAPIVLWAIGAPRFEYQPPMSEYTEYEIKRVVKKSVFSSGRTKSVCNRFGLDRWVLDPASVVRDYGEIVEAPSSSSGFYVCWGSDKAEWRSYDFEEAQRRAITLADTLRAGWVRHVPEVDYDLGRFPFLPEPTVVGVPTLLSVYKGARAVFTNRKHGILIPRGLGVPAFALEGSAPEVWEIEQTYPIGCSPEAAYAYECDIEHALEQVRKAS